MPDGGLRVRNLGFFSPSAQREPTVPSPLREMPQIPWGGEQRTWDIPLSLKLPTGEEIQGFVKPDTTVWAGGKEIGMYDSATGQFTWKPMGLGEQLVGELKTGAMKALEWGLKPFEYFHEYVAKPFAMAVSYPAWGKEAPEVTPGRLTWEDVKAFMPGGELRKPYEEWEEPVWFRLPSGYEVRPTKGLLELIPWFAIPPAAKVAGLLGKAGKVGQIAAKALTPVVKAEALMGKAITLPLKVGGKVVGKVVQPKKFVTPELKAIDLIEAEMVALHPERLAVAVRPSLHPFRTAERWVREVEAKVHERVFKKAQVVERADFEVGQAAREVLMPELDKIGNHIRLFGLKEVPIEGTKASAELVTASWVKPKVEGASMALGDILRNPESYIFGASINGQKAKIWVDTYRKIIDALDERFGTAIRERLTKHGLTQRKGYAPFRVLEKRDLNTGELIFEQSLYPAGTRPGARLPSQRPAVFKTQYEGMKAGYKYADQYRALDDYIQELYNMAKGDRGIEIIGDMALTGKQRMDAEILARSKAYGEETKNLAYIKQALNRVKRGEKLPTVTIRAIERNYPDAGRAIRMAIDKRAKKLTDLQYNVMELENRLAAEVEASGRLTETIVGEIGSGKTIAIGSDPTKKYSFKFAVVEAEVPIASHTSAFTPEPRYPKELQPRLRERALPREQVERMARELEPEALLVDTHRLDSGSMILGLDDIVESGNGRIMAIRRAIETYPERYGAYRRQLEATAELYGLKAQNIKNMKNPILVRRRTTEVPDRVKFVRESNESIAAQMSPLELAFADTNYISEESLTRLSIEGKETLTEALRDVGNSDFIRSFLANVPMVDRAQFLATDGTVSRQGIERISNAILAKAFPGRFGLRLAEWNVEAIAPQSKIIITGLAGSSGDLAKLTGAIKQGRLSDEYHIALDLAEAAERFIRNKTTGMPIEAAMQATLFEPMATPIQRAFITALDDYSRSATRIRDLIRGYVNRALGQPAPGQALMPGFQVLGREEILGSIIGKTVEKSPVLKPAVEKAVVAKVVEVKPPAEVPTVPEVKPVVPRAEVAVPEPTRLPEGFIPAREEMTLERLLKDVRDRFTAVKAEAKAFAPMYREARQRAMTPALTEGRIVDIPAWMNRVFPDLKDAEGKVLMTGRDIAKKVEAIYAPDDVNRIIKGASQMARAGVTVKAALDLSWMFIQGSLVMGYDVARWATGKRSSAWLNGTKEMIKTMFNQKYRSEFLAKNPRLIKEMIENGVVVEKFSEFIEPGTIERMMKKVPLVGDFLGSLIKETYGRAGAGFSTGGLAARTTIYRQARDAWLKEGRTLKELGEFVNKLTGVISSRELGVGATRRAVESATLFAPRYTRAYLMVMRDLLRGNKTGTEVRKAMAGMMVGGVLAYSTLATALGQEPKLNPAPKALGGDGAEFMAFKIGGSTIGLPGFWYSAIRMMAAVNAAVEEDPERLLSLNWRENDFLRFWMGRTSPLVRLGDEIVEGKDFLGRRLDEPEDWLRHLSEYLMTIATVNLVTRHPSEEEGRGKRFGAELFGLRAFPRSDWDKLRDMKGEYSQKDFGKPFEELNLEEKDKLLEAHSDYKEFQEEAKDRVVLERGEDVDIQLWSARKVADAIYRGGVEDAAKGLLSGLIDYRTYLDAESTLRKVYKGQKWAINYIKEQADPDAQKELLRYLEEQAPEDKALSSYWDIYSNPSVNKETGLTDWDATEKRQDAFLASLDAETKAYVMRNKDRWVKDLPPIARQLAEIQVQGWDVVDEYYDQPEGKERLAYRRANPTVDAWLLVMGRVSVPQTPMAMQTALRILREKGLPERMLVGIAGIGETGAGTPAPQPQLSGFRQIRLGSSRRS